MKSIIKKALAYIRRYIKHPLYMLLYPICYMCKNLDLHISFYSNDELVELIKKGKSIIRMGDGEMVSLALDLENMYHVPNKRLKKMMKEIVSSYNMLSSYILSVPIFLNKSNAFLSSLGPGKRNWGVSMKAMFLLEYRKNVRYLDAHCFYYDNFFETFVAPHFLNKKVILVTNADTIELQKNNQYLPWKDIVYIESPRNNAVESFNSLMQEIYSALEGVNKSEVVILMAMGPVGKYILYKCAEDGYQGIDIGKGAEVMFTGKSIAYLI